MSCKVLLFLLYHTVWLDKISFSFIFPFFFFPRKQMISSISLRVMLRCFSLFEGQTWIKKSVGTLEKKRNNCDSSLNVLIESQKNVNARTGT